MTISVLTAASKNVSLLGLAHWNLSVCWSLALWLSKVITQRPH